MIRKLSRIKNKILIFLLIFAFVIPIFKVARAWNSGPNNTYPFQFYNAVFESEEMNLQSFVYETLRATMMSVATLVAGSPKDYKGQQGCYYETTECLYQCQADPSSENCPDCDCETLCPGKCPQDQQAMKLDLPSNGGIPQIAQLIGTLYANPPASGVQYLAGIGQKMNLVKPVYAQQGIGWGKMSYLLPIWQGFRNISYFFFILVLIFLGFAIMFRIKTSPQTVVSIQSAIPKVVLVLILVTFSYAIAGLLIDLMYVVTNIIIFFFSRIVQDGNWPPVFKFLYGMPGSAITSDFNLFMQMFVIGALPVLVLLLPILIIAVIAGGFNAVVGLIFGIVLIILILILFIALIRILWSLLRAYVSVLLAIVFGPLILCVGALPGNNSISGWFRGIIQNLLVFPVVMAIVYLSAYITLSGISTVVPGGTQATVQSWLLMPIIGIGILLMAPSAANIVRSFFDPKRPFEFGTALTAAMTGGAIGAAAGRYGAEMGIQGLENRANAAGRAQGADIGLARVLRNVLHLRR